MSLFYDKVYKAVRSIPAGKVCTYGQVALMIGCPGAARQVGWSLASLPTGTEVPWHRVINYKGGISFRGRLDFAELQRKLLEDEGVVFNDQGRVDLKRFQYLPDPG